MLGPVELLDDAGGMVELSGAKMRGLLAVLAVEAGRTVTPQRLIDVLWGEQEVHGPNVVQGVVSKLRKAAAADASSLVVTRPAGYELAVAREQIDLHRFEQLVDRAGASPPEQAADLLSAALALWRGVPLGGAPDTGMIDAIRARLSEMRESARDQLTEVQLALGQHHRLVGDLEALIVDDPLRERRWAQLMRALYGAGRQADAMRAFQRARAVLVDTIGAEPGPELRRLEAAVLAHDDEVLIGTVVTSGQPIGEGFRRTGNMRHATGPCVGRHAELRRVVDQLEEYRCVTLTGTGGVGKTRLALEVCARAQGRMADGVWWTDLRSAHSAVEVMTAVQRGLQLEPRGNDVHEMIRAVATVLSDRDLLLVLDNCEQVVGDVATIVGELVPRCAGLRVLATSRESLGILSERVIQIEPLATDAAHELFAMHLDGTGVDQGADAELIDRICARLDRLPLALELAAAGARHLRLDEILQRLEDQAGLPAGRSQSSRLHDLHAVADWSYQLLEESERRVFERLSVFADGATVDAARAVCAGSEQLDVEPCLYRLVDKSLVVADRSGAQTRFRMLQTLADYALARLRDGDGEHAARAAHAEWVSELAASVRFGAVTTGSSVAAVEDEHVAVRDAIQWATVHHPHLALEICDSMAAFWFGSMRVSEGFALLSGALDAPGESRADLLASAMGWMGLFATVEQNQELAAASFAEALRLEATSGDRQRLGRLSLMLALAAGYAVDDRWPRWVDEARAHFAAAGDPVGAGHVDFAEGAVRLVAGDSATASMCLRAAIDGFQHHHDHLGLILAVSRLGELAYRHHDIGLYAEMHSQLRDLGLAGRNSGVVAGATARLAHARLIEGDVHEAERLARAALASSGGGFMPVVDGYVQRTAGLVNIALGHVVEGRDQLDDAIDAFEHGAGGVGAGQAAMCWIDLGTSLIDHGEITAAVDACRSAVDAAQRSGDPWIIAQAAAFAGLPALAGATGA